MLHALTDAREKSVVAQTAAGQVREFQLRSRFSFRAAHAGRQGTDRADRDRPQTRDLSYTESAALAKEQEEAVLYRAMQSDIVSQVMRRLASVRILGPPCRFAPTQLAAHLARELRPLYTVWGDEPLLAQEAADAIRAAARAGGCSERQVHTVAGAHFDWSGLLGAAQALSLFAERQLVEIRIPSGKPGKEGSEALQRYCEAAIAGAGRDVITLVQLPRLDGQQQKSAWFAALDRAGVVGARRSGRTRGVAAMDRRSAWPRQGQRVASGDDGRRTLAFFADRVEGNLLAAHQEIAEARPAVPRRRAELRAGRGGRAQRRPLRRLQARRGRARRAGRRARCACSTGCEAEGEAAVLVHWTLAEDIRGLKRVKDALAAGRPLPLALREARVWGAKERLFERAVTCSATPRWPSCSTPRRSATAWSRG